MSSTINDANQGKIYDKYEVVGAKGADYATQPDLQAKSPIGNGVSTAAYKNGVATIISTMSADTTNSSTNTLDTTASTENRSAKFKNPQVKQDQGITYSDQK